MLLFEIAASLPLLLTGLAALWGGVWGWLALGYITVLVFTLDRLIAGRTDNPDPEAEFPAAAMTLNAPRHGPARGSLARILWRQPVRSGRLSACAS